MNLDLKEEVLTAIYSEYINDFPEMKRVNWKSLEIKPEYFLIALIKLENEGFISGNPAEFCQAIQDSDVLWVANRELEIEEMARKQHIEQAKNYEEIDADILLEDMEMKFNVEMAVEISAIELLIPTMQGVEYIEERLEINSVASNQTKAQMIMNSINKWGRKQLVSFISTRLQSLLGSSLDKLMPPF